VISLIGFLLYPLTGYVIDKSGHLHSIFLISILWIVWAWSFQSHSVLLISLSFAMFSLCRSCVFVFCVSYVLRKVDDSLQGILLGSMMAASGLMGLMQNIVVSLSIGTCHDKSLESCEPGHWNYVNVLFILSLLFPLLVFYNEWVIIRRQSKAISGQSLLEKTKYIHFQNYKSFSFEELWLHLGCLLVYFETGKSYSTRIFKIVVSVTYDKPQRTL